MKAQILIICTGNTCRSQMAEFILKSFDSELNVKSAGTEPGKRINPRTLKVMAELGMDMSNSKPKIVSPFVTASFDYVITVCDDAREICPAFLGLVKNRLHIGFEDPAMATGTEEEVMSKYREIRDQIHVKFKEFYEHIKYNIHD
jgi:arsenate reductase (thioredoxin)